MDALPPSPAAPVPPPAPVAPVLTQQDTDHLRLLSIFHYVVAGLAAVFALIFVIHIVMGIAMLNGALPMNSNGHPSSPQEQRFAGWMFIVMGSCIVSLGLVMAGVIAYAGRCLKQRRRYLLCMIVAGLSCLFTPFGTVLGVFTLIVLLRPQVKAAFEANYPSRR
ncbi:TPA: hypothetical protein QDZ34_003093 [Stenotrophomonas maltophilia]|nr:hypothetical protein [Stenotrophomonas maltophilia]HDS1024962.1 hypothetical protein [Stenotrophomonas maltophilia]HDS1028564.1 hypothetical protein [Stenotrophomonas maltophilia]HDS1035719.1 hypothetical protein [Stenotrophomonas maltophilia]